MYYKIAIFTDVIFAHEKAIQLIDAKYYQAKFSAMAIEYLMPIDYQANILVDFININSNPLF